MPPELATVACVLFILGLLLLDWRRHLGGSPAIWLVVAWVVVLGSRPVSTWLGIGGGRGIPDNSVEGNAVDESVVLFLILAAVWVLKVCRLARVGVGQSLAVCVLRVFVRQRVVVRLLVYFLQEMVQGLRECVDGARRLHGRRPA